MSSVIVLFEIFLPLIVLEIEFPDDDVAEFACGDATAGMSTKTSEAGKSPFRNRINPSQPHDLRKLNVH